MKYPLQAVFESYVRRAKQRHYFTVVVVALNKRTGILDGRKICVLPVAYHTMPRENRTGRGPVRAETSLRSHKGVVLFTRAPTKSREASSSVSCASRQSKSKLVGAHTRFRSSNAVVSHRWIVATVNECCLYLSDSSMPIQQETTTSPATLPPPEAYSIRALGPLLCDKTGRALL